MRSVELPISKSIANRILLLQAINGDELMPVAVNMPDDVVVLHDALTRLREYKKGEPLTLYLKNCGTALRFLQVHLRLRYPGEPITLDGDERLKARDGAPTSQTTSALIMHGIDVPVEANESPYITMTRKLMANGQWRTAKVERDWSAAAFWYEYMAIHGGELLLKGLTSNSIQGDRIVADIYAKYFGVETTFVPEGAQIVNISNRQSIVNRQSSNRQLELDFSACPDLYPAVALTCERLGITLQATGTERLKYKESDRLESVRLHEVRNDHRMAMALMCAEAYNLPLLTSPEGKELQSVIAKSYPTFIDQFNSLPSGRAGEGFSHITPIRGVNDDNLGKKHALSKLIHAASSEYVWLHDDDIVLPEAVKKPNLTFPEGKEQNADLIILPLSMESENERPSLLERLQMAEYAAIQELTMRMAKEGAPVMCSGANLIVRREAWLACETDLHPEIPSGDDMFLLEAMKRRGMKIGVIDEPEFTAMVRPVTTWRAFFRQRMRWAGKAPHYTDTEIRRCGAFIVILNLLQLLCPPFLLIKFPVEYCLIRKREPQTSWLVALLLEILYPFYMLICLIGGRLSGATNRW